MKVIEAIVCGPFVLLMYLLIGIYWICVTGVLLTVSLGTVYLFVKFIMWAIAH